MCFSAQFNTTGNTNFGNSHFRPYVARWSTSGVLDTTWGAGGLSFIEDFTTTSFSISTLVWSGGTVTVTTTSPHGLTFPGGDNMTISGANPSGFNGTFIASITGASTFTYPLAVNPGTVISAGNYVMTNVADWEAISISQLSNGKILAGFIYYENTGNAFSYGVAQFNTDGTLDNTFGTNGVAKTPSLGAAYRAVAVVNSLPSGNIVVSVENLVGGITYPEVACFLSTGAANTAWGSGSGIVSYYAMQADCTGSKIDSSGNILIGGALGGLASPGASGSGFAVMRLTPTLGLPDPTFGSFAISSLVWSAANGGMVTVTTVAPHIFPSLSNQGNAFITGAVPSGYNVSNVPITVTGASTFTYALASNPGTATNPGNYSGGFVVYTFPHGGGCCTSIQIQPADGKIVCAGQAPDGSGHMATAVLRLNTDGTLDTSFGSSGYALAWSGSGISGSQIYDQISKVGLDGSGNVVVGGQSYNVSGTYYGPISEMIVGRFTSSGALDTGFASSGFFHETNLGGNDTSQNMQIYYGDSPYLFGGHLQGQQVSSQTKMPEATLIQLTSSGALDTSFGSTSAPYQGGVSPPAVTTNAASSIGATTATANATINPNAFDTDWLFLYGPASGRYTNKTASADVGSGSSPAAVTASLTGLTANTTYYGRAAAWSSQGLSLGAEISFTTT